MQAAATKKGVTLILGVDAVMDMARTSVNVVGNCLATVVISKWEGEFDAEQGRALLAGGEHTHPAC